MSQTAPGWSRYRGDEMGEDEERMLIWQRYLDPERFNENVMVCRKAVTPTTYQYLLRLVRNETTTYSKSTSTRYIALTGPVPETFARRLLALGKTEEIKKCLEPALTRLRLATHPKPSKGGYHSEDVTWDLA